MNTDNKFLNSLFNNLSSIYSDNQGMINSNLFALFNAYASVFKNIDDIRQDTYNNAYLNSANEDVLEDNFSPFVDFPKPPRLNTVTDGGEIYRAILRALYDAFLNGSTEESMDVGLTTVLSFLTIDDTGNGILPETNNVFFNTFATQIQLAYPALTSSGTPALPSDITISPSGLTVYDYDPATNIIQFSGDIPIEGQDYVISYLRDHQPFSGTDWINFTDPTATSPLPTDLNTIENTYRNPKFSYWWETFNRDGNGVQIIDGTLDESEQGLVWRLPEKYISYIDPYTDESVEATINLYNLSGNVFDINSSNKDINPDPQMVTPIISYVDQISRNPSDFYIRYSANNNVFLDRALEPFVGDVEQVEQVSDLSVDFASDNFGTLDFFEKGENFDENNLFGNGTKHVWTNVPNSNGIYSLSAEYFFDRQYSLHENILFKEFFESGDASLNRFSGTAGQKKLAEAVGVPIVESERSLQLFDGDASVYPVIPSGIVSSGNRLTIDMYDSFISGVTTTFEYSIVDPNNPIELNSGHFRFVIPENTESSPTFSGANGFIVNNTAPYSFVDTYFPDVDNADYSVDVTSGFSLVAGNPNVNKSSFSLQPSGAGFLTANLDDLAQADELIVEMAGDDDFWVEFSSISPTVDASGNYIRSTDRMRYNAGVSPTLSRSFSTATLNPGGNYTITGWGGFLGAVPNPSTSVVFRWVKGQTPTVNGVNIPGGPIFPLNLGMLTGATAGTGGYHGPSREPFSNQSIYVNMSSLNKMEHFVLGNSVRRERYLGGDYSAPYYYQVAGGGQQFDASPHNILNVPRQQGWHRLISDLGVGFNEIKGSLDKYDFFWGTAAFSGTFGTAGNIDDSSVIKLNSISENTDVEYSSFFDNFEMSYYTPTEVRPQYNYSEDITKDWQGSYLNQSAVLSNRVFKGTRRGNFVFELIIKGLQDKFVFIIQELALKLKPAHTLLDLNVQTDHTLNTTNLIGTYVDDPRNWETGNLLEAVYVTEEVDTDDDNDLPGTITISGTTI